MIVSKEIINLHLSGTLYQVKKALEKSKALITKCSHLGSNQGPSDYESDALTS